MEQKQPAGKRLHTIVRDGIERVMNTVFFVCGMVAILAVVLLSG